MGTVALLEDEVVLYNGEATSNEYKGNLKITLTSLQIVVEKEKGIFKKEIELLDTIALEDIKTYNDVDLCNPFSMYTDVITEILYNVKKLEQIANSLSYYDLYE